MIDIYIECGFGERSAKVGVFDILNTLFDSGVTVREVSRPLNLIRTTNCIIHAVSVEDMKNSKDTLVGNFYRLKESNAWIDKIKEEEGVYIKLWNI